MSEVRRATLADADAIWGLTTAFATSFHPERSAFDRGLADLVGRDDSFVGVAVSRREPSARSSTSGVVGYVLASSHVTLFANGPVVWVEELMVDPAERRTGVGRQLMDAVETWARTSGAAYVSLATRRASDFYLALGYDESATYFRKLP